MMSKSASSPRSFLLAGVVALGLTAVWGLAVVWTLALTEQAHQSRGAFEQIYVRADGVPVIMRHKNGFYSAQPETVTLAGEPTEADPQQLLNPMYLPFRPEAVGPVAGLVSAMWSARLAAVNDAGLPLAYWYLVHDGRAGGLAYGVGYHSVTKQCIGYFGRSGFVERLPPRDEWFQVAGGSGLSFATPNIINSEPQWVDDHVLYLLADGNLWSIDPRRRKVRALAELPTAETIGWAWRVEARSRQQMPPLVSTQQRTAAPRTLLVRWRDACALVDPETGNLAKYPLPLALRRKQLAGWELPDGELLLISNYVPSSGQDQQFVWFDRQGKIVRQHAHRLTQFEVVAGGPGAAAWMSALAAPLPAGQMPLLFLYPTQQLESGAADSYGAAFVDALTQEWPAMLAVAAIGIVSAAAAYRRQKRFGLPGAAGWAVFGFLFGAPGWLAYRLHRDWPPQDDCPACGQSAPQDRETCLECGAPFPSPAPKGIEVFA